MCVIMAFAPGAMMNKEQFFNAVYNNWHGYGLILKDENNKTQLIKGFDEKGTDPEALWKLMEDNKDLQRFLHVRHSTKGSTDETNVQPFPVYNSSSREIYFMHNGTLSGFGDYSKTGKSDTLEFCEKILQPALLAWTGPNGKADYSDEVFVKLIIDKQWSTGSTGLFVSNFQDPKRIGYGWKLYEHPDSSSSGEIWVSNTLYFEKVSRGPRFLELEAERKAREDAAIKKAAEDYAKNGAPKKESTGALIPFEATRSGGVKKFEDQNIVKDPEIIRAMNTVISCWDINEEEDLIKMSGIDYYEWLQFLEEDIDHGQFVSAALIDHLITSYRDLMVKFDAIRKKQLNAEARLREINVTKKKEEKQVANG